MKLSKMPLISKVIFALRLWKQTNKCAAASVMKTENQYRNIRSRLHVETSTFFTPFFIQNDSLKDNKYLFIFYLVWLLTYQFP